jgi:hypothetical protein
MRLLCRVLLPVLRSRDRGWVRARRLALHHSGNRTLFGRIGSIGAGGRSRFMRPEVAAFILDGRCSSSSAQGDAVDFAVPFIRKEARREVLRFAQDFGVRLRRRADASTLGASGQAVGLDLCVLRSRRSSWTEDVLRTPLRVTPSIGRSLL